MRAKKAEAGGLTPTSKVVLQKKAYQKSAIASTEKLQIGQFLLYLCARGQHSMSLWGQLEAELREGLI